MPRGGPKGGGGGEISRFFFPRPPLFSFFLPLLGVVSWNIGGVIEGRDPQMCTFGVLGLSCERNLAAGSRFFGVKDGSQRFGHKCEMFMCVDG